MFAKIFNKLQGKWKEIRGWKLAAYCFFLLLVLTFIFFRSLSAFEYRTESADPTMFYSLESGETVTQDMGNISGRLNGLTIYIGTAQEVNHGTVTASLLEDGQVVRQSTVDAAYLLNGAYQDFYFTKSVKLDESKTYSLTLTYQSEEENSIITPSFSQGGKIMTSADGIMDDTLVYQLIVVNNHLRCIAVFGFFLLFIVIFFLCIFTINVKKSNVWKAVVLTLLLIVGTEAVSSNLMKDIQHNVLVKSTGSSEEQIAVGPGESVETTFSADYADFDRLELYPVEYEDVDLTLSLTNLDTGEICLQEKIEDFQLIQDDTLGENVIPVSANDAGMEKFPMGSYTISIYNNSEKSISFRVLNAYDGMHLCIEQIRFTWIGTWIALGILGLLLVYMTVVFLFAKASMRTEIYFLISVIPLAIIYLVLFQTWNTPDASYHFHAVYRLSNTLLGYDPKDAWYIRVDDYKYYINIFRANDEYPNPNIKSLIGESVNNSV